MIHTSCLAWRCTILDGMPVILREREEGGEEGRKRRVREKEVCVCV